MRRDREASPSDSGPTTIPFSFTPTRVMCPGLFNFHLPLSEANGWVELDELGKMGTRNLRVYIYMEGEDTVVHV